jgi:hypothetical protein
MKQYSENNMRMLIIEYEKALSADRSTFLEFLGSITTKQARMIKEWNEVKHFIRKYSDRFNFEGKQLTDLMNTLRFVNIDLMPGEGGIFEPRPEHQS